MKYRRRRRRKQLGMHEENKIVIGVLVGVAAAIAGVVLFLRGLRSTTS